MQIPKKRPEPSLKGDLEPRSNVVKLSSRRTDYYTWARFVNGVMTELGSPSTDLAKVRRLSEKKAQQLNLNQPLTIVKLVKV
jgi:hypothetical protein